MQTTDVAGKSARVSVQDMTQYFRGLEDPRDSVNRLHSLDNVLVIAVLAVMAGAGGPTAIAEWARLKFEFLSKVLDLPHGVPRKDVFRRVLSLLKPTAFQAAFANWIQTLYAAAGQVLETDERLLAVDGKALRRSHDHKKGLGALHSVSVWASEFGLTLAAVATDQKSNEITAIPEVLAQVNLRGVIVTIDAMGTQTAIAQQIVAGKGDYVLAVKGNQGKLYEAVKNQIHANMANDYANVSAREHVTEETGHGRRETRMYVQMPAPKSLPGFNRWAGLMTIGIAMLTCVRNGKETTEMRYFISSLPMGVKRFARAIRSHWSIENSCHWILDMTYREDESRIRQTHERENFAWLNRFTLSLFKQHKNQKSVAMNRRRCGWDENVLLEILTGTTT